MSEKRRWAVLIVGACLASMTSVCPGGPESEFSKDGKTYQYVWRQYLDAQVVSVDNGRSVEIFALRSGQLQQKAGNRFLDLRKVIGLWRATLDPRGRIGKNELVTDVTTHVLEKHDLDLVPPATLNAKMMAGCGDAAGRIHILMALPVLSADGKLQNRLFYLRERKDTWEEMITGPQAGFFPGLTAFPAGDDIHFYYLESVRDSNPPLIMHSLPANRKMESKTWLLFGSPGPHPISAYDFTAFARQKNPIVVFRDKGNTAFSLARWEESRKSWDVRKDVFSPRIENALAGDSIGGLSGLATADGVLHVFGAFHFNDKRQIVHFHCPAKGDNWNCDVILNQPADWLSSVPDGMGRIHLIGVNGKGEVWYALGDAKNSWSFKGILLDEATK